MLRVSSARARSTVCSDVLLGLGFSSANLLRAEAASHLVMRGQPTLQPLTRLWVRPPSLCRPLVVHHPNPPHCCFGRHLRVHTRWLTPCLAVAKCPQSIFMESEGDASLDQFGLAL